jgi:hypothetical protein
MTKIKKYELRLGKLAGTAALGIPMYADAGQSRTFTGTNKEVNEFSRLLNADEPEGFLWSIRSAEPVHS